MMDLSDIYQVQASLKDLEEFYIENAGGGYFRKCVEDLLKDTPWAKLEKHDVEGLYGRVRNAIKAAKESLETK